MLMRLRWLLLGLVLAGSIPAAADFINDGPGADAGNRGTATCQQYLSWYRLRALLTDTVWNCGPQFSFGTVSSGSITPNLCAYTNITVTLGATGLTLANPSCFQIGQFFQIDLVEDGTGSRTITTYGSMYKFAGGTKPTLTTAAAARDRLFCNVDSATVITCNFGLNYS